MPSAPQGLELGSKSSDQQFARVVFVIGAGVVIAHDRQIRAQSRYRIEQGVVMLAGMQGHVHADRGRQFPRPHAGAQDHAIGFDLTPVGNYSGDSTSCGEYGFDRSVLENARTGGARALRQGVGDVDGVCVAVGRYMDSAEYAIHIEQRNPGCDRCRIEHLHFQSEDFGHGRAALQFLESLLVGGK